MSQSTLKNNELELEVSNLGNITEKQKCEINSFIGGNININNILNNNMMNFENKQMSTIYFIVCKIINEYTNTLKKNSISIDSKIIEDFLVNNCIEIINNYYSNIKKRNRKKIDKDSMCKGRKLDGHQCTRKKKVESDPRQHDADYITLWEDIINDEKVLIDIYNNVFTFDMNSPIYLGKKTIDNTIIPAKLK